MQVNAFDEIKARVGIMEAFTMYGGSKVDRSNKALCPFHDEKTASLTLYPQTASFYCFGCGVSGSVIDLVGRLYGLEPFDAAKRIDSDYHLGLFAGELSAGRRCQYIAEKTARERKQIIGQAENSLALDLWADFLGKLTLLYDWRDNVKGKTPDEVFNDKRFIFAAHNLDYYEYLIDGIFSSGDYDENYKFHRYGEEWQLVRIKENAQALKRIGSGIEALRREVKDVGRYKAVI